MLTKVYVFPLRPAFITEEDKWIQDVREKTRGRVLDSILITVFKRNIVSMWFHSRMVVKNVGLANLKTLMLRSGLFLI